jgi:hypothetical protein
VILTGWSDGGRLMVRTSEHGVRRNVSGTGPLLGSQVAVPRLRFVIRSSASEPTGTPQSIASTVSDVLTRVQSATSWYRALGAVTDRSHASRRQRRLADSPGTQRQHGPHHGPSPVTRHSGFGSPTHWRSFGT